MAKLSKLDIFEAMVCTEDFKVEIKGWLAETLDLWVFKRKNS